jgi:hypothetical protein
MEAERQTAGLEKAVNIIGAAVVAPPTIIAATVEEEHAENPPYTQQPNNAHEQVIVPRTERRGLFSQFTLIAEIEDAKSYPRKTKWFITSVVGLAAMAAPMGSTIFFRMSTFLVPS